MRVLWGVLVLCLGFTNPVVAGEAITAITLDGTLVRLSEEEVAKAFAVLVSRRKGRAEKISINDDGSATILGPWFLYEEKQYRFWLGSMQLDAPTGTAHLRGVCARFGYRTPVASRGDMAVGEKFIVLHENGQMRGLDRDYALTSVTCR